MKLKNFLILVLAVTFLGNGCAKISNQDGTINKTVKTSIPSGKLDPQQLEYTMADRQTWYYALGWTKNCEEDFNASVNEDGGLAFYPLGNEHYLLRVNCYLAAYQKGMVFYDVSTANHQISAKPLDLKTYNPQTKQLESLIDPETNEISGYDLFDEKNKKLSVHYKMRGVGDCGSSHEYMFDSDELVLVRLVAQSCEDADEWHLKNPNADTMPEWPVIYEKK